VDRHEDPAPTRGQPRLLDQVRDFIRRLHYSIRTEQTYVNWIRRFILFHRKRHPKEMGAPEVEAFLTHLAVQGKVAACTQNQALNAIVFLYRLFGFRTRCSASRCFSHGLHETPFHGPEAGKRRSQARSRASEPGGRGPEGRFHGLEGGMNGPVGSMNRPVGGIRASEARVSHRVGGKRTPLGRATGSENPCDARRSRGIAVHGGQTTVSRAPRQ